MKDLKFPLINLSVILLIISVVIYLRFNNIGIPTPTAQSPEFSVNAETFKQEYNEHGLRANEKYADKTIVLRGEITSFGKYPNLLFESEKVYIVLDEEVVVYLDAEYMQTLLMMDEGDYISVACKVPDAFAISIKDCRLW